MIEAQLAQILERSGGDRHEFESLQDDLVDEWTANNVGFEAFEPVLRFMEAHPDVQFGAPGGLVHFVERFYGSDAYDELLLLSVKRMPTPQTVWMLNRAMNATRQVATLRRYLDAMAKAAEHPWATVIARDQARHFLEHQRQRLKPAGK